MQSDGLFRSDLGAESDITLERLVRLSNKPTQSLTFTCVPPGSGVRMGIDRDEDGVLDGDEVGAESHATFGGKVVEVVRRRK